MAKQKSNELSSSYFEIRCTILRDTLVILRKINGSLQAGICRKSENLRASIRKKQSMVVQFNGIP